MHDIAAEHRFLGGSLGDQHREEAQEHGPSQIGPGTVTVSGTPSRPSTPNAAAPIHAGDPGFSTKPDRDEDGVGRE
ncbi:MAG: excalibur calcium-binding domain-containing protein [Brachybacterium sp.]